VIGWLTLLIVTVGRTLAPMLALAPTAPPRRFPLTELSVTAGRWVLVVGLATSSAPTSIVGASMVVIALGRFGVFVARVARTRRIEFEGPLAHLLAGVVFLLQAVVLGFLVLGGAVSPGCGPGGHRGRDRSSPRSTLGASGSPRRSPSRPESSCSRPVLWPALRSPPVPVLLQSWSPPDSPLQARCEPGAAAGDAVSFCFRNR